MNEYTLSGRVNFVEIKYTESGKVYTRVLISEKQRDDSYVSYPITLFNTKSDAVAERFADEINKGDYAEIKGKLTVDKFKTKNGEDVERIGLIGFSFDKLIWDSELGKMVKVETGTVDNEKFSTVEKTPEEMFTEPSETSFLY